MKRRSGKIFAATLALLVCLNAMPLGTLAAGETAGAQGTEQTEEVTTPTEGTGDTSLGAGEETGNQGDSQSEADKEPGTTAGDGEGTGDATGADEGTPATTDEDKDNGTEDEIVPDEETDGEKTPDLNVEDKGNEILDGNEDETSGTTPDGADDSKPAAPATEAPNKVNKVAPAQPLDNTEDVVYYVNGENGDDTNEGTKDQPFKTLAAAAYAVTQHGEETKNATITLLSDLTTTKLAYFSGDINVTIDGQDNTIFRGNNFVPAQDGGRGGYNAGMIEVANGATLTLVNITLDDLNKRARDDLKYEEQPTGDGDKKNEERVQDSIIAAYGDGAGTIILGSGTTLKNFGGMSAVRIGGNTGADGQWHGSKLIMESGSRIIDDDGMGAGRKGGMGAIWSQGGRIEMAAGSSISDIDGRAIYCEDGGTALINGEISKITSNEKMMHYDYASNNGFGGIAIYSEAKASTITLGETGTIHDIITWDKNATDVAVMLVGSTFEMLPGSSIKDIETIGLVDSNEGTMKIGGEVSNCHTKKVFFRMRGTAGTFELGENGIITNCSTTDAGIVYMNGGKPTITISGTMSDIDASEAIFISNNGSRQDGTCTLTETGVIKDVSGTAILAGDPSHVSISGEISKCGGYAVNYGAVKYNDTQGSYLEIKAGAKIHDNNGGNAQICLQGKHASSATDAFQHVDIAPGTLIGNQAIDAESSLGTITLDENYAAIGLGMASTDAVHTINTQVQRVDEQKTWKVVNDKALWFQPSQSTLHFTVARPKAVEQGIGLHVAYIPLEENGNPASDATVTLLRVNNRETIDVTLSGLTAGKSYALALVKESKYYVTINPVDITVYMGGERGATNVVGNNGIVTSDSLPEPGFAFDLPLGVTDIGKITFREVNGTKTWTAVPYDNVPGHTVYKLVASGNQDPVRVQFTDKDSGKVVVEDEFTVGAELNKTFSMGIYKGSVGDVEAYADGNAETTYGIILNEGTLTVRGTTDKVQFGGKIAADAQAPAGQSAVKVADGTQFTINESPIKANTDAIALLFDNIIENTNSETGRTALLTKKADETLKNAAVPADMVRNYQFKYLDLVDTSNGNAWVKAVDGTGNSTKVTVCWPYPEGTDKNTEFTLLHFEGLHREMSSNEVAADIASCHVSPVNITKTDTHIEFTTTGFSPFALAWNSPKPVPPVVEEEKPENDNDEGGTTTTPAATPAPTAQPAAQTTAAATTAVIPQTSDNSQPALWAGLLVFSGAALAALYLLKRRKQNGER